MKKSTKMETYMKLLITISLLTISSSVVTTAMESNKRSFKDEVQSQPVSKVAKNSICVKCPICDRVFKNHGGLIIHEPTHDMRRPYTCNTCKEGFISEQGYLIHKSTKTHKYNEARSKNDSIASPAELLLELSKRT